MKTIRLLLILAIQLVILSAAYAPDNAQTLNSINSPNQDNLNWSKPNDLEEESVILLGKKTKGNSQIETNHYAIIDRADIGFIRSKK